MKTLPRQLVLPCLLVVALLSLFLSALAVPALAGRQPNPVARAASLAGDPPAPPESGLTAIDLSVDARPALDRLGILYQGQPRAGVVRAAASAQQLAALDKEGIVYAAIARVAIFEGTGRSQDAGQTLSTYCLNYNEFDYVIPKLDWVRVPIYTWCPGATTVDWIDIHFILNNVYYNGYPPGGQGLSEIFVNFGSTNPTWTYVNVGEAYHGICAPSSPPLDGDVHAMAFGTYDRWIFNVDATMGTSLFYGRPVNQHWDLSARHECPNSPAAVVDYWDIWVYYTPLPTATFTATGTHTSTLTRTATSTPTATRTRTATSTRTRTATPTPTRTAAVGPTRTSTATGTRTPTPTRTATGGLTPTPTRTATQTGSPGQQKLWLPLIQKRWANAGRFTVNTTSDTSSDGCTPAHCSLREAISAANSHASPDVIAFNIPAGDPGRDAAGVCTIQPLQLLPFLSGDGTTIDGFTQPGASAGATPTLKIVLDGHHNGSFTALAVTGSDNLIRGLVIGRFTPFTGIHIFGSAARHNRVERNYIGTDASGTADWGNGTLPVSSAGVWVSAGARDNIIGPDNLIAFNSTGVWIIDSSSTGNTVTRNRIRDSDRKGIALYEVGPAAPAITGGGPGSLSGTACAGCTVEVFSDAADEGAIYEGTATANAAGQWTLAKAAGFAGPFLTATATNAAGSTSEFSAPVPRR